MSAESEGWEKGVEKIMAQRYFTIDDIKSFIAQTRKEVYKEGYDAGVAEWYKDGEPERRREQTIADYQTNHEQRHIAEAVKVARREVVEEMLYMYEEGCTGDRFCSYLRSLLEAAKNE